MQTIGYGEGSRTSKEEEGEEGRRVKERRRRSGLKGE
jgi:hypothetical protein